MRTMLQAAGAGVLAALGALASAELVSMLIAPGSSPFFAVGALAIDLAPPAVKDTVIALFGTGDKLALLVLLGLVVAALAGVAGLMQWRRPPFGLVLLAVVAVIPVVAVITRSEATVLWLLPTVIGFGLGLLLLRALIAALRRRTGAAPALTPEQEKAQLSRRRLLGFVLVGGLAAAAVTVGVRTLGAGARAVDAARSALRLPTPATAAAAPPAGADLALSGITPYVTSNGSFYRIDTALQVPQLDPTDWRLRITGMVENEVELSFAELLALPLEEHLVTLACVSNTVGGDLIGNALWLGYPIRELLARAAPLPDADMVLSRSSDGWTASTPLDVLSDPDRAALLAVGMNGEPLPLEHGFPVRMVVPGLYGYVSATKWVVELEVTRFDSAVAYWSTRGWTERGPIKTASRIDVPADGASLVAGDTVIAGVAWAQHVGIEAVEVNIDDGGWQSATLAATVGADTWRQWSLPWTATAGEHSVVVRATDSSGYTQTADYAPPAPDGATGWHTRQITVS